LNTFVLSLEAMKESKRTCSAWLSLGSNLGDRKVNLDKAIIFIRERLGRVERVSAYYESDAWGFESSNAFLNCCLELHTTLGALVLLEGLLDIEQELGRTRSGQDYADRTVDLDLLLYDQQVLDHPKLKLPHPGMAVRRFVLEPLAEIAPGLQHPLEGKSIAALLAECPDSSPLRSL